MGLLLAKHLKGEIIEETVKSLTDEEKLLEIVKNDVNLYGIRELATKQITNNDYLKEIVFDTTNTSYEKAGIFDIRETATKQITDDTTLLEIVNNYYDENINTKYGLNVVENATYRINSDDMLLNISQSKYDEEIVNIAVEKLNKQHENTDKTKLTIACNDDSKAKRLCAINQIDDDEILLDIAMNAKYLDVREIALSKISIEDERIPQLKDLITQEKDYHQEVFETISEDENQEPSEQMYDKAKKLGVEYKRMGNPDKAKFYNEQCKLLKNSTK